MAIAAMALQIVAGLVYLPLSFVVVSTPSIGVMNYGAHATFYSFAGPFHVDINYLLAYYWQRALTGKHLRM